MGWTRIRIRDGPVLPGLFSRTSRKKTKHWELSSMGNLSVLEEANVRVCGCVCLCVGASLCIRVSGGGAGRCPGPHPSAAPLPAASLSHLLWQMFGCPWQRQNRMYTSGLQQGQAHTHRPPTPFPSPKACCKEPFGSRSGTNGVCIRRQAELASSEGSVAGEEEDACARPS